MPGLLSCVVLAPAAGALALGVTGRSERRARVVAITAAACALLAAIPLWFRFQPRGSEWQFTEGVEWLPSIGTSYLLGIDGLSLTFVLLTAIVSAIAVCSIGGERVRAYGIGLLLLETGLLGGFLSLDFLLFVACWMLAMAGAVLLLAVSGATRRTVIGVAIAGLIAGALMLAGVLALERHDHSLSAVHSFDMRPYHQLTLPAPLQNRVFLAFVPGLAMAPLLFALFARTAIAAHPWLMLPGVLALNVGVFGLFRVSLPMVPGASRTFLPLMLGVSILVAWSGAIASLLRTDWKRSIAGASIAYAALATFGTFALTPDGLTGSVVQHVSLALSLGAIFIIEGRLRQSAGGSDGRVPVMILVLIAACLSIAGMPLLAGFVGLRRSVEGVWPISRVAALAVVAAALVAAAGMGRLYARRTRRIQGSADGGPFPEVRFVEIALPAALASLSIWIGLYPAPLLGRLETSVARVVLRVSPQYAAQVADCLTQPAAPPPAAIPGLPAGMVMAAPCADGSNSPPPAAVK